MARAMLVTGVAGFLGSHVADDFLLTIGKEIRGIDDLSGGYTGNVPDEGDFRIADARHPNAYRELIDGVEIVYDCAAAPYEGLSVAIAAGVRRYVYCSSMSRDGNQAAPFTEDLPTAPVDPYTVAKCAAEATLRCLCRGCTGWSSTSRCRTT